MTYTHGTVWSAHRWIRVSFIKTTQRVEVVERLIGLPASFTRPVGCLAIKPIITARKNGEKQSMWMWNSSMGRSTIISTESREHENQRGIKSTSKVDISAPWQWEWTRWKFNYDPRRVRAPHSRRTKELCAQVVARLETKERARRVVGMRAQVGVCYLVSITNQWNSLNDSSLNHTHGGLPF